MPVNFKVSSVFLSQILGFRPSYCLNTEHLAPLSSFYPHISPHLSFISFTNIRFSQTCLFFVYSLSRPPTFFCFQFLLPILVFSHQNFPACSVTFERLRSVYRYVVWWETWWFIIHYKKFRMLCRWLRRTFSCCACFPFWCCPWHSASGVKV